MAYLRNQFRNGHCVLSHTHPWQPLVLPQSRRKPTFQSACAESKQLRGSWRDNLEGIRGCRVWPDTVTSKTFGTLFQSGCGLVLSNKAGKNLTLFWFWPDFRGGSKCLQTAGYKNTHAQTHTLTHTHTHMCGHVYIPSGKSCMAFSTFPRMTSTRE